ncbi:MAG: DUF460 domain-containing protein [Candidatus Micrarchaeota archaeon]|nr:DUF460 domain-containing protein [Candidatus Micrarchaeota archaeon]
MARYIIVGVDPGATVGLAVLDLNGRQVAVRSLIGAGSREVVARIQQYGTPSLIACDVEPAPELAHKIASYFSCRLFLPNRTIREDEKRKATRSTRISNSHERDAYAAAILAFRAYANKLRQIDSLEDLKGEEKEKAKHLVLKGYKLQDALLELAAQEETIALQQPAMQKQQLPSVEQLKQRVLLLARQNANLKAMVERLESEKRELERRLKLLENGARQALLKDREIRRLRFNLERALRELNRTKRQGQQNEAGGKEKIQKNESNEILNVDAEKIDLEAMVMEYRRNRGLK